MKRGIAILTLSILLFSLITIVATPSPSASTVVRLDPATVELGPDYSVGETFTLAAKIDDVEDLAGLGLQITWNTTYLEYVSHTMMIPVEDHHGGIMHEPILVVADSVNETKGTYDCAVAALGEPTFYGSGTAFEITFRVKRQPMKPKPDATFLVKFTLDDLVSSAPAIPHFTENCNVTIYAAPHTPITIYVPDDYSTIQEAIDVAYDGDTIFVHNGTYYENIYVNKSISLVGEDKHGTIIDGNFTGGDIVSVTADSVSIGNFTIRNVDHGMHAYGINMNSSDSNIRNTIITNTKRTGGLQGIQLWNSSDNTIAENQMYPYNELEESGVIGVKLLYSSGNTLVNNEISFHTAGIFVVHSEHNTVNSNELYSNWYGIRLQCSSNNTVVANNISKNVQGIYIVSYDLPAINNLIYHNNFVNNTHQATPHTHPNIWQSYPFGNYWSDYNGTDLYSGPFQNITGSDGVGDTPYIIDENNTDMYPLMNPYVDWNIADVNNDLKVDLFDIILGINAYGSTPLDTNWNPRCDIAPLWNKVDIFDIVSIAYQYGETYT